MLSATFISSYNVHTSVINRIMEQRIKDLVDGSRLLHTNVGVSLWKVGSAFSLINEVAVLQQNSEYDPREVSMNWPTIECSSLNAGWKYNTVAKIEISHTKTLSNNSRINVGKQAISFIEYHSWLLYLQSIVAAYSNCIWRRSNAIEKQSAIKRGWKPNKEIRWMGMSITSKLKQKSINH